MRNSVLPEEQVGAEQPAQPPSPVDAGQQSQPAPSYDPETEIEAAKAANAAMPKAFAQSRTCLIVDDSRVVRRVARGIAETLGYTVIEAENGQEALGRCRMQMPDLILTDWQMPIMSGIEFVSQVRAMPGANRTKIVFCTSKSEANDIHDGISAGADDYVIKPFDEMMLTAKLERIGAS